MSKPTTGRIPFEPNKRNKKVKEAKQATVAPVVNASKTPNSQSSKGSTSKSAKRDSLGIPDEVNRRIVRRAALFCGVPTGMGIATFVISYFIVTKHIFELPTSAVVLVSMLFLGLGVLGLSYGAISASWDEGRVGTWWGSEEFKKNFGYLTEAWKAQKKMVKESQKPQN